MTRITIDIPDDRITEAVTQLKELGVKIHESDLSTLDELTKEDYIKHFASTKRDATSYLLKSPTNATRLLNAIAEYK
jgi:hypothetical protein